VGDLILTRSLTTQSLMTVLTCKQRDFEALTESVLGTLICLMNLEED
jgi:hypothetical protein